MPPADLPTGSRIGNRQMLLVEDEKAHAQLIDDALQLLDPSWEMIRCVTGSQALDHIEKPGHAFELAVVDLGLPDIGGLDIVRAWRKRFPTRPLLVVSAIAAERTVLEAIRGGASGYLLKTSDAPSISRAIAEVLDGQCPISPALARYLFKMAGSPQSNPRQMIQLTAKESETLQHFGRGFSYAEMAELMGVSVSTIQTHVRNLYRKLGAHSQTQAVVKARDHGLL